MKASTVGDQDRAVDRVIGLGVGIDAFLDLRADELHDASGVDAVFDVIAGEILERFTALVRAGGTLLTIARPPTSVEQVRPLGEAPAAFAPDRSTPGKTIIPIADGG